MSVWKGRSLRERTWFLASGLGPMVAVVVAVILHKSGEPGMVCALPFLVTALLVLLIRGWRPINTAVDLALATALLTIGWMPPVFW